MTAVFSIIYVCILTYYVFQEKITNSVVKTYSLILEMKFLIAHLIKNIVKSILFSRHSVHKEFFCVGSLFNHLTGDF